MTDARVERSMMGSPARWIAPLLILVALWSPAPLRAGQIRFETDNDFLTSNPENDDLYTFSLSLAWEWAAQTVSLREHAFTDKDADLRFDETYLTLARELPLRGAWRAHSEAGLVYVGRGLFGQTVQNELHDLVGDQEVDYEYVDNSRIHPWGELVFDRRAVRGPRLAHGPRFSLTAAPGFQAAVMAGWRVEWSPPGPIDLGVTAGLRYSHTAYAPLEPHIAARAAYGGLEVALWDGFVATWTYNAYGTERQHVAFSWRFAFDQAIGGRSR
jgi:hypothetical protein